MMSFPLKVFCCYARQDQEMLEHLKKFLWPFRRKIEITVWGGLDLNTDAEWEIRSHLVSADIILLLISPEFMDSIYEVLFYENYHKEMRQVLERHKHGEAYIVAIMLRSTSKWPLEYDMTRFPVLPTNGEPVISKHWPSQDEAFFNIVRGVERIIYHFTSHLEDLYLRESSVVRICYFYAAEDKKLVEKFEQHLSPFRRKSEIMAWFAIEITKEMNWTTGTEHILNTADIVLFLVSPALIASDTFYSVQIEKVFSKQEQKSAQIIPIILRATTWEATPLGKLQPLPMNRRTVVGWRDRDKAFLHVIANILKVVRDILSKRGFLGVGVASLPLLQEFLARRVPNYPDIYDAMNEVNYGVRAAALDLLKDYDESKSDAPDIDREENALVSNILQIF